MKLFNSDQLHTTVLILALNTFTMFEKLLEVQLYACCLGALFLIPAASILIHAASLLLQIYAPMLLTLLHYLPLVSVAIAETIVLISLPVGILFVSVSPAYEMNRGLGTIYGQLLFRATTGAIWLGLGPLCLVGVFLVEFVAFGKVLQSPRELAIISISCQIVEGGDHCKSSKNLNENLH